MPVLEGTVLGAYELLQRLASGGMAEVYCARQLSAFGCEVALKVILPYHTEDQTLRTRFLREAYTISRLAHPHILPLIEFGDENGTCYLVMPLIREGTLRDLLKQHSGRLPIEQAIPLFIQLCDAVQYAHDQGIIHRDIKPQNIWLQGGRHVLLADFGITRTLLDTQSTATGVGFGATEYRAPEQTMGQADARSDIYSLGIVLYQMLTGMVPSTETALFQVLYNQSSNLLPDPRAYTPTLPDTLVEALQTALAQDPQDRFASAAALSRAVQQAMGLTPSSAMPRDDAGGWGAGPPPDDGWLDAPTWPGQGDPRQRDAGGGGPPYDGEPPGGWPPGGGWPPDDNPDHHRGGWPPLVALALALFLLIVVSSLAYGFFGLGWLHPNSGGATITPTPTSSPQPTSTPTPTSPAPSPTPAPSPSPTNPSPTPGPSPSPTSAPSPSPNPSPSPGPSPSPAPAPSPSPPEPGPSPTAPSGP